MGVGSAQRVKGVKWGVARKIVITWIITMPISAVIAELYLFYIGFILLNKKHEL